MGTAIDENAVYEVDGKQMTGRELKGGILRQEDYTVKTQQLSERAKELETTINSEVEKKFAAIKPQVDAVIQKGEVVDKYFEKDPEAYQRFVAFADGKEIPVVNHGGKASSQQAPAPVFMRDPKVDARIESMDQRLAASEGERAVAAFAQEKGLTNEFVWETLLPSASENYSNKLPPKVKLEKAWQEWRGQNAEEIVKIELGRKMDAAHISGGGRGPIDQSQAEKIRQDTLGKLKGRTKPEWLR